MATFLGKFIINNDISLNGNITISGNVNGGAYSSGSLATTNGNVNIIGNLNTTGNINGLQVRGSLTSVNIGYQSTLYLQTYGGANNTAVGYQSLCNTTSGNNNTAIGCGTLSSNTLGSNNTAVGLNALSTNGGVNNTAVGYNSCATGSYSYSTAIGYSSLPTQSNQVMLGTPAEVVVCPNKLGVGITNPQYPIDISGNFNITSAVPIIPISSSSNISSTNTYLSSSNGPTGCINILNTSMPPVSATGDRSVFLNVHRYGRSGYWWDSFVNFASGPSVGSNNGSTLDINLGMVNITGPNYTTYLTAMTLTTKDSIGASGHAYVGINKYNPQVALDVGGTINYTGSIAASSDYRIKGNVVSLNDLSYNVDNLKPIKYINKNINNEDMGFFAHEIQEYFPFLVSGVKDGEHMQTVNYTGLIALLVKEIQDLKKDNIQLKNRMNNIEQKIV